VRFKPLGIVVAALALSGCGKHAGTAKERAALTEQQRDSVIARSTLPGASVVGKALEQSAGAEHHAAELDSLTR
jgi:hypothetical protein